MLFPLSTMMEIAMAAIIENKQFWKQQVEKLKASGLSRTQYCRTNSINYHRFGYWLKKLPSVSSKLVPVKLQPPEATSPNSTLCTLELRGYILKIHDLSALSFVLARMA
jgi:hypothetical protein